MSSPPIDELSPVKLPLATPIIHSTSKSHKTADAIVNHAHGLEAKMVNRRNTIDNIRRISLIETPLQAIEKPQTLTSRKYVVSPNIESIKRSKLTFDSILRPGSDKENKNPFESSPSKDSTHTSIEVISSPIKRSRQDLGQRKTPKIFTNANDISSEQIDEVFVKHDLVGQFSTSPKAVYENGSDSEVEDYGRIESTISQTIMPNTSALNQTMHKLNDDYVVTPQRFTEPVAKSPATNQHIRVNEVTLKPDKSDKDTTSPLKIRQTIQDEFEEDIIDISKLENEPTINFLLSPNSKPVFSKDQINKIEYNYNKVSNGLRSEISQKASEIKHLQEQLTRVNDKLDDSHQQIRELTDKSTKLSTNEEVISIQLKHNERELASLTKKFKIQESVINNLQVEKARLCDKLDGLTKSQHAETERLLKENELQLQLIKELRTENEELNDKQSELVKEIKSLQDLSTKQEELLKELDNLEILANNKIINLEKNLQNQKDINEENVLKFNADQEELTKKIEELLEQESKYRDQVNDLHENIDRLSADNEEKSRSINRLTEKLDERDEELLKTNDKLANLQEDVKEKERSIAELNDKLEENNSTITNLMVQKENDTKTIEEYTVKLEECVEAMTKQKSRTEEIESKYVNQIEVLQQELKKAEADENNYWKKQYNQEKINSEQHIKEVAEYLHQEYKNKHEKKLREARKQSESQIIDLNIVKKSLEREIELLNRKLTRSNDENKRLSDFIYQHKLQYQDQ